MQRRTLHFSGHVQGVGFRFTARQLAGQYKVTGFVRNLRDGRVELVMEGAEPETTGLLHDIYQRMEGYIEGADESVEPATGEFRVFEIRS